jgi:glycosyltransferase involved in cell wall biosynthesis
MRIVHVMPSLARAFGGPTQSLVGYVRAARAVGIDVEVAAPACPEGDQPWLDEHLGDTPLNLFPGWSRGSFMASPALVDWLGHHARRFDVVHVHGLLNLVSSLAARKARAFGLPVVVRPFGTLSRYTFGHRRGWIKRRYFQALDRPNLRRARALHFTTAEERDEAGWHGLGIEDRSFVVPPPLTDHLPRPFDFAGKRDILFLSRLHPKKNTEALLRAWALLRSRQADVELVIAGDGEPAYVSALIHLADELGVAQSVRFTGFVLGDEKARLLHDAGVFVLPSYQENFGVAVLEAIAAGVPVVVSPHVQLASFVERHRLGRVVDPSPESLAHVLEETLDDMPLRLRCRLEGPALVSRTFSPDAVGRQLLAMYETVLANRNP